MHAWHVVRLTREEEDGGQDVLSGLGIKEGCQGGTSSVAGADCQGAAG